MTEAPSLHLTITARGLPALQTGKGDVSCTLRLVIGASSYTMPIAYDLAATLSQLTNPQGWEARKI
jgi:hypothetical protein